MSTTVSSLSRVLSTQVSPIGMNMSKMLEGSGMFDLSRSMSKIVENSGMADLSRSMTKSLEDSGLFDLSRSMTQAFVESNSSYTKVLKNMELGYLSKSLPKIAPSVDYLRGSNLLNLSSIVQQKLVDATKIDLGSYPNMPRWTSLVENPVGSQLARGLLDRNAQTLASVIQGIDIVQLERIYTRPSTSEPLSAERVIHSPLLNFAKNEVQDLKEQLTQMLEADQRVSNEVQYSLDTVIGARDEFETAFGWGPAVEWYNQLRQPGWNPPRQMVVTIALVLYYFLPDDARKIVDSVLFAESFHSWLIGRRG